MNLPADLKITCDVSDWLAYQEEQKRRIYITEEINSEEAYDTTIAIRAIWDINRVDEGVPVEDRKPICLYINSVGGALDEGFALVDAVEASKTPIYTVGFGKCASMAFLLLIAGHKRYALPRTTLLLHDGSTGILDSTGKVLDYADFLKRLKKEVIRPHVLKHSKMKAKEYDQRVREEFYMLPADAIKYGFIDEIITDLNAFDEQVK